MKRLILVLFLIILSISISGCKSNSSDSPSGQNESSKQSSTNSNETTAKQVDNSNQVTDSSFPHFEIAYHDYEGTINQNMPIQLSIYPLGNEIIGSYFYEGVRIEIQLKGTVDGQKITLNEYDSNGKNTGVFEGSATTVDIIEGTWSDPEGKMKYPFRLDLQQCIYAEYGKRYQAAGVLNEEEVESFAELIQKYISNDEKEKMAALVYYPVNVYTHDDNSLLKTVEIKNREEFIRNYDAIIHPEFKKTIGDASTKYMFANWQGIMFGEGFKNMWINHSINDNTLLITSINN